MPGICVYMEYSSVIEYNFALNCRTVKNASSCKNYCAVNQNYGSFVVARDKSEGFFLALKQMDGRACSIMVDAHK